MADAFSAAGYKTAIFGKWHLGDSYPNLPNNRGFQESVYHLGWGITSMADLWQNDYFDGRFRHNGKLEEYPGYCTDVWFNLGLSWIKERKAKVDVNASPSANGAAKGKKSKKKTEAAAE